MRLGIVTPVVNLNPRFDPPLWEIDGGIDDVVAVAQHADGLGYSWVGCPEHVAIPEAVAEVRGGRYWDPIATLGFVAARTTRIGLLSHVIVLGYHHPLEIVKRFGTLDLLSGGRVILGVGVGSLQAEFELLGAEFSDRGARADDALRAIRASFGRRMPAYDGEYYGFDGFIVEPASVQEHLPIWVGGRTRRSLRRALELGDGWIPFGLTLDEVGAMLAAPALSDELARRNHQGGFEVVLAPDPLDPLGEPAGTRRALADHADVGATALAIRLRSRSRDHYLDQLEALAGIAGLG